MKQITAQQFANMFGMYVAKDGFNNHVGVFAEKPTKDKSFREWNTLGYHANITQLISDADSLDWNILIEPQE
jgi:hypothetical protein